MIKLPPTVNTLVDVGDLVLGDNAVIHIEHSIEGVKRSSRGHAGSNRTRRITVRGVTPDRVRVLWEREKYGERDLVRRDGRWWVNWWHHDRPIIECYRVERVTFRPLLRLAAIVVLDLVGAPPVACRVEDAGDPLVLRRMDCRRWCTLDGRIFRTAHGRRYIVTDVRPALPNEHLPCDLADRSVTAIHSGDRFQSRWTGAAVTVIKHLDCTGDAERAIVHCVIGGIETVRTRQHFEREFLPVDPPQWRVDPSEQAERRYRSAIHARWLEAFGSDP